VTSVDIHSALQVGKGEFAFAMDVTGLQTFQEEYGRGMPLGTMAQWAWHAFPNTAGYELADVKQGYDSHGRQVFYPVGIRELREEGKTPSERTVAAETWLRENLTVFT
jgi:protein-glucosylgalactosylhydroxylysine glucosidase